MAADIPYPSIVFVPLDVLTAEELNQLHANTSFLANLFPLKASSIEDATITGSKVANNTITSANINWGTLETKFTSADSGSDITVNAADTTLLSVSLTPGKWALIANCNMNTNGTNVSDSYIAMKNGTSIIAGSQRFFNGVANAIWWLDVATSTVFTATSNTTINLVAYKAGGTLNAARRSLMAIRVG